MDTPDLLPQKVIKITLDNFEQKNFPFKMKKILTVSKHFHSKVGLIHVISLGASQKTCRGDVCRQQSAWGCVSAPQGECIGSPRWDGKFINPCVAKLSLGRLVK